MKPFATTIKGLAVAAALFAFTPAQAATYTIDTAGAHASINFKVMHLGMSWLTGRFNTFSGQFEYDSSAPEASSISVDIDTASIDSNHEKRDTHLRSADFLETDKFPKASFVSKKVEVTGDGKGVVTGDFTLRGVTRELAIDVTFIGEGKDPWGGNRVGFEGTTAFEMPDYGMTYNLGPASTTVYLDLHVEGIRQ